MDGYAALDIHHVNSLGESLNLNGDGLYLEWELLHNWSYEKTTLNGQLVDLVPATDNRSAKIHAIGSNEAEAEAAFNSLIDHFAPDRICSKQGRLYVGEWYLECVFTASEKQYYKDRTAITQTYAIHADNPRWIREKVWNFVSTERDGEGLNMGFDYPHDYGAPWYSGKLVNGCPYPCPVRIIVEGPAEDWYVHIGSNKYQCSETLIEGEYLVIDGVNESIQKVSALGNVTDAFSSRLGVYTEGSGTFVFEQAPAGVSAVSWDGCKAVAVTVYEQSDERPMAEAVS